ncbi:MAG: spore coat protein CotJB [Oscillospiraceae bacterium]
MEITKPEMKPNDECSYKCGKLPECAPLATSWVPMQQENPPVYGSSEALTRGTLFPGLDLPFKNMVNKSNPYAGTPLGELMALRFMAHELHLYLDTHKDDKEAFKALKETLALEKEGRARYAKMYGPLTVGDLEYSDSFNWLDDPWPWEFAERTGRN